jgi:hypothetical protein
VGDASSLPVDHPELEPQAAGPDLHGLAGVRNAQLGSAEDVDDVERTRLAGRLSEGAERRDAEDGPLGGVDWNALVSLVDEVAEDTEGRTGLVRRGANNGNPTGRPEGSPRGLVIEDGDRAAILFEVQVGDRPGALEGASGTVVRCRICVGRRRPGRLRPVRGAGVAGRGGRGALAGRGFEPTAQVAVSRW